MLVATGNGLLRVRGDAAGDLFVDRERCRDQVFEAGIDALVADGGGVRDVARYVLQREGLSLKAAHRNV
jgi:hypothetical protein